MENPATEKTQSFLDLALAWAKKDFLIIVVCLLCLLACLVTLNSVGSYQQQVNAAWQDQWDMSGCAVKYHEPNISFNMWGDYANEIKD